MTGNPYIDAMAYTGFGVWGLLLFGFPLWMLIDWLRSTSARHVATREMDPQ